MMIPQYDTIFQGSALVFFPLLERGLLKDIKETDRHQMQEFPAMFDRWKIEQ
jgi:hypothetical protein